MNDTEQQVEISQNTNESEDTISRQAVINVFPRLKFVSYEAYLRSVAEIENIPPVTTHQKTGQWLIVEDRTNWYDATYKCSCCGREVITPHELKKDLLKDYPYCHCGAKMHL